MTTIFIDGSAGTTGLRIRDRLSGRKDLCVTELPEAVRKDPAARQDALNRADLSFLCLPDAAAEEAASLVTSPDAVLIDTSTAHRTAGGWCYGFPELHGQRDALVQAKRIANPGCHATGFIVLIAPLTDAGVLRKSARLSCFSLTGYSGGGKKMIAEYEDPERDPLLLAPRQYGLGQQHKHLPEMVRYTGLSEPPVFCPIVAPYYAGMEVTVPLTREDLSASREQIREIYRDYYRGSKLVRYSDSAERESFLSASALAGYDDLEISVHGTEDRIVLTARFDNLGKGASGAAIQNMNLVLGLPEDTGLETHADR